MAEWLNTTFYGLDNWAFCVCNNIESVMGGLLTPLAKLFSTLGKGGILIILISIILALFRKTRRTGVSMLIAIAIGFIISNLILKVLVNRPRPYTAGYADFWIMVGSVTEKDASFPSGHSTVIMSSMLTLFLCSNKKKTFWVFFIVAFMAFSRVYLIVHYLTDVIVGLTVGAIASVIGYYLGKYIFSLFEKYSDKAFCSFLLNADIRDIKNK